MQKLVLLLGFLSFVSFKANFYEVNKKTAEVTKVEGLLVFIESEPVAKFQKLGEVKKTLSLKGNYFEIRKGLIKKAKADFKDAEGVILYLSDGGFSSDKADVIKFVN